MEKVKYNSSKQTKVYPNRFLISVFLLAVSSCGQTGPLYLPGETDIEKENLVESGTKS